MNSKLDAIGEYVNGGFSELNMTLNDVKNVVLEINQTFTSNITEVLSRIELMNNSVNLKLDEVIANQTYMQIYLETSLFPMLNATYQNTLNILIQLGIIEAKVDVAIDLSNQTLIMLNETKAGVDELLNSSRRIRAWITV
jgi:adenine-specific DNA methylase